ncbi:MAG: PSD1 domain-containing protein [Planctomycetes bacterium]|nr:PSD1 domain-containing protein [Planctomycetota bacterium]
MLIRIRALVAAALAVGIASPFGVSQEQAPAVDFRADLHPLLKARCFKCHAGTQLESGIRLDFRPELLGETNGRPLVLPGRSGDSSLIKAVTGALGADKIMPPSGKKLTAREIGLLRAWIDQGATWDEELLPSVIKSDHWAFKRVRRPEPPDAAARNPVDAFITAGLRKRGLTAAPEAPRRILIRRLSLDLTGLPPTRDEIKAFVDDAAPDAYERLVERLLASPRYGERWGRHWLDVARYADSEGYESNHPRPYAWRYRDYVVDSFNRDKPFDRFLREQIAGDEMEPYSDENLIATGFLAAARLSSNEEDHALQRNDMLVDVVNATAAAFLGLTMNCAQCHSHKFDPLTQRDYYRLQTFFVKGQPNNLALKDPALWTEFNAKKPAEYEALVQLRKILFERGRQRSIDRLKKKMSPETLASLEIPDEQRSPEQRELFRQADLAFQMTPEGYENAIPEEDKKLYVETKKKLEEIRKKLGDEPEVWGFYSPATSSSSVDVLPSKAFYPLPYEPEELRRAAGYLRIRGEVHRRGGKLTPGWPEVLGPTPAAGLGRRPRLALADWMTSRDNPLVARVWVNRVWHYHFGRGLVSTPGDFGVKGAPPAHPELLDWLAAELMEKGWSSKHLHRLIVGSEAYRRSSQFDASNAAADPDNEALWRWSPRRLEAEAIRDSALAVTGELDLQSGGAPVATEQVDASLRRSLYLMQKRDGFPRFHAMFDGPTANESCACRQVSTVALQPLLLLNNPFMVKRSKALGSRAAAEADALSAAFELALGRPPTEAERKAGEAFVERSDEGAVDRLAGFCSVLLNLNEFVYLE